MCLDEIESDTSDLDSSIQEVGLFPSSRVNSRGIMQRNGFRRTLLASRQCRTPFLRAKEVVLANVPLNACPRNIRA